MSPTGKAQKLKIILFIFLALAIITTAVLWISAAHHIAELDKQINTINQSSRN